MDDQLRIEAAREMATYRHWSIHPNALAAMVQSLQGGEAHTGAAHSWTDAARRADFDRLAAVRRPAGQVAILPLLGPLFPRGGAALDFFGGTSMTRWGQQFDDLIRDPAISAVVVDGDSPGGTVAGTPELADKIFAARNKKPVVFVANPWLASAAYWLASQGEEVVVTPSGEAGSIGVWSMHMDLSKMLEQQGIKPTLIASTPEKVELSPYQPLSREARAYEQQQVDQWYGEFVSAAARGRRVSPEQVRSGMGEGRMAGPRESVRLRLANRVATLQSVIDSLSLAQNPVEAAHALRTARLRQEEREYRASLSPDDIEAENRERRLKLAEEEHAFMQATGRN